MQDFNPRVRDLSVALRQLHKALVDAEAENFGPIDGPFRLLHLVTNHEHFAWLRGLSELMAGIDALRKDSEVVASSDAHAVREKVEALIDSAGSTAQSAFGGRYAVLLQQSPAAAMAHGDVRRALGALPARQAA